MRSRLGAGGGLERGGGQGKRYRELTRLAEDGCGMWG